MTRGGPTSTLTARFAAICALAIPALGAGAQSIDEARAAFADGRFLEAAELGEALGTSDGYALAAKSLAVHAHYRAFEDEWEGMMQRAIEMGEEAVRADSANAEAYFQSAHAVGRYAESAGVITALRQGFAGRVRDLLEATLALEPDHAGAHLSLAAWHADIDAAGFLARRIYPGRKENAIEHFRRSLELEPDSKAALFEYAVRLPELDKERGLERAREMLERALAIPARSAHEELIHLDIQLALRALPKG